jgi:tripartite-type tricarboxylate transporter receptor subunit TctC
MRCCRTALHSRSIRISTKSVPFEALTDLAPVAFRDTPRAIGRRLNEAYNAALLDAGVREELNTLGFVPTTMTPDALAALLREETVKWGPIIAGAGISAE